MTMKKGITLFVFFAISLLVINSVYVSAVKITARLGEPRKIIRAETGEEISRFVYVQNINEVPITIDLQPSGDLAQLLELNETQFVLQPNEDRKVYYTIKSLEPGTTETKINVRFTPPDGDGIGLTAVIVLLTYKSKKIKERKERKGARRPSA